jgi:hypothetical protein
MPDELTQQLTQLRARGDEESLERAADLERTAEERSAKARKRGRSDSAKGGKSDGDEEGK